MQVAVTYMWLGEPLLKLIDILEREFGVDSEVWLDIIFNDQRTAEAVGQVNLSSSARQKGILALVSGAHSFCSLGRAGRKS